MNRYLTIARHEITTQLRRKAFVFFAFIFPALMLGLNVGIGQYTASRMERENDLGTIGVVDHAGVVDQVLNQADDFRYFENEEAAEQALVNKAIGAYFVISDSYILTGQVDGYTLSSFPESTKDMIDSFIRENLLADQDQKVAARIADPMSITMKTIGGARELDDEDMMVHIMTPIVFSALFAMSVIMTSSYLMQSVVEEKESRMVELMISSVSPKEILYGKVLGLGAIGLMQIGVWITIALIALTISPEAAGWLSALSLPWWILVMAVVYILFGYLLYGSLLAGIGASSSSLQEAQSISGILTMLVMSPIFALAAFISNPSSAIPVALSLIPFTSPTGMMMRLTLSTVPWWQLALSLLLLALTAYAVVWLAAWVFRAGLLLTGKRLTPSILFRTIRARSNGQIITVDRSLQ
ncbi:MAG: ABC transporter permease [Chloroflexota bacterium]